MKFFRKAKDGGPESTVTGYWLAEIKWLFSIVLLRFDDGTRDSFHSHAFDSLNWVLKGCVREELLSATAISASDSHNEYTPSILPVLTRRETFHRVRSFGTTWVLSIRGPWRGTWREWSPKSQQYVTLTHGRKEVRA